MPGYFTVSLDVELAWGSFDHGGVERLGGQYAQTRELLRRFLASCDQWAVPCTFAMVGHLMLESCERGETTHPEVGRPRYSWYPHDWHQLDPGTDVTQDSMWYGPDMLAHILESRLPHEIGTHTFTHIVVDDPACTREIFRSQLDACIAQHERLGLPPLRSIVYPRNQIAHLDVLTEVGITSFRGKERSWYRGMSGKARRLAHLVDRAAAIDPPTYRLDDRVVQPGLCDLPASMMLLALDGPRRYVPLASRKRQAIAGLRKAAERGELFHLWFHPFNLASGPGLLELLDEVFAEAARLRDAGQLRPITMEALASQLLTEPVSAAA